MNTAEELMDDLNEFKKETLTRFKSYPIMDEDKFGLILRESLKGVLKESEKVAALNRIYITSLISGVIIVFLILFIIYIMLFTVPV